MKKISKIREIDINIKVRTCASTGDGFSVVSHRSPRYIKCKSVQFITTPARNLLFFCLHASTSVRYTVDCFRAKTHVC